MLAFIPTISNSSIQFHSIVIILLIEILVIRKMNLKVVKDSKVYMNGPLNNLFTCSLTILFSKTHSGSVMNGTV